MTLPLNAYYTLLQTYLWPQWHRLGGLAFLLLTSIVLQLLPPQLMRRFLDTATAGGAMETLSWLAGLVIAAVLVQQLCAAGAAYLGEAVAWTATNQLRVDLMDHCLHLDLTFHHARTPGECATASFVTRLARFCARMCWVPCWRSPPRRRLPAQPVKRSAGCAMIRRRLPIFST